jgi:hypothetical protein
VYVGGSGFDSGMSASVIGMHRASGKMSIAGAEIAQSSLAAPSGGGHGPATVRSLERSFNDMITGEASYRANAKTAQVADAQIGQLVDMVASDGYGRLVQDD